MWRQATRGIASGEYSRPKSVLGFYGILVGLLVTAMVSLVCVDLVYGRGVTPYVTAGLIFLGALTVLIVVGVFVVNITAPQKLMLGTITGSEHREIQQLTQGDNVSGERLEMILPPGIEPTKALPSGEDGIPSQSPEEGTTR